MNRLALLLLVASLPCTGVAQPGVSSPPLVVFWDATAPGNAFSFFTEVTRKTGSPLPLQDFTVAAQLVAKNGPGVHQWAFGVASEAIALPGSRSILVGAESAAINMEPTNDYPKVGHNVVFKNRYDGAPDPGVPMNRNSLAYFISAQPGTGFERGIVYDANSLLSTQGRPAAIDLSDIPDDRIGTIDLIRIRKNVALRYDPATRQLVLHTDPN